LWSADHSLRNADVEKIRTYILCLIVFFPQKNRAVHVIRWPNKVGPDMPDSTVRRMRFASWMTKATNTHRIIFAALPLQQ